jgi:BirA family biotin operon repressor/biotin-[acetyl-CoA-carboxylase] ligase
VAVARAIERLCPLRVEIKWVNDLYVSGRKLCGILTEAGLDPVTGRLDYVVLGIGVNVAPIQFPPELETLATSLGNEGCVVDRNALIAAILNEWERAYATMDSGDFLCESRRRSCVLGKRVTVSRGNEIYVATAVDINEQGHLLMRRDSGETEVLASGEVSVRL